MARAPHFARGLDGPHLDRPEEPYWTAAHAQEVLGVARRSLYTYVSRGWIRRREHGGRSLYLAEDVRRVAQRSAARRGHTAVAASALRWGEPVLDSAITSTEAGRLRYRGRDVVSWLDAAPSYEEVADWVLGAPRAERWPRARPIRFRGEAPVDRMFSMAASLAPLGAGESLAERWRDAREIILALARVFGGDPHEGIASSVVRGLGLRGKAARRAIEDALIVSADHELNASSFAARIAAGTGASLGSAVASALFAFNGPRHGRSHDRIEALVKTLPTRGLGKHLEGFLRGGGRVVGFGHPLYPLGDPRALPLLGWARRGGRRGPTLRFIDAWVELTGELPMIDVALVAMAESLGAPPGTATGLFALGRSAGWLAHAMEQSLSADALRPRARYVGPGAAPQVGQ